MKLCRFNGNRLGVVEGYVVRDVSEALGVIPRAAWPLAHGDLLLTHLSAVRRRIDEIVGAAPRLALNGIALNTPVANPTKVIGAPVNYHAHADEIDDALRHGHALKPIGEWGLFLKATSALSGVAEGIRLRFPAERTDYEVELAVVLGKAGSNILRENAMSHVAGYAIGLDITLRGPQFQSFRKSIDTYAVLGPHIVTADELGDPGNLALSLKLNGEERQASSTSRLIFDVPRLIEFASSFYTLYPGDVIMTGTPSGVGQILPGDVITASIERIGTMNVSVVASA